MSNGVTSDFHNREASLKPLETNSAQATLLADASGVSFRDISIYSGKSMTSPSLPALSLPNNNNEISSAGYGLTTYSAYYQPNPYYFTPQSTMGYPQYSPYSQYQYASYNQSQPNSLTSVRPYNPSVSQENYRPSVSNDTTQSPTNKDYPPPQPLPDKSADKSPPPKVDTPETEKKLSRKDEIRQALYEGVNRIRAKHGLDPLTSSKKLEKLALANSDDMRRKGRVGHIPGRNVRENAAMFPWKDRQSAKKIANGILTMWMNSPGHRTNILSKNTTKIGAGINGQWETITLA